MAVPAQQKVLYIQQAKGDWQVATAPVPQPNAGQVLVKVETAGLNPADWKIHDLDFAVKSYPTIIGFDGAGVVVQLGEGVKNVKVGDRVYVLP